MNGSCAATVAVPGCPASSMRGAREGREGQMLYRMSSHLLGGKAERFTALVDGMRKK